MGLLIVRLSSLNGHRGTKFYADEYIAKYRIPWLYNEENKNVMLTEIRIEFRVYMNNCIHKNYEIQLNFYE